MTQLSSVPLKAPASTIEFGELDGDSSIDAAVLAGDQVFLLHGESMQLQRIALPISTTGLMLGTFLNDRSGARQQLALLSADGSVHIVAHDSFDPRAYSVDELKAIREAAPRGARNPLLEKAPTSPNENWKIVESFPSAAPFASGFAPVLVRSRVSSSGLDDVLVLNSFSGQMVMISHRAQAAGASTFNQGEVTARAYAGSPVSAISMRVNADGRPGFVVLHQGQVAPSVAIPLPDPTFNVNTTADTKTAGACAAATPGACSLREAIIEANASPGIDTIMVPAGTYTLTIPGANENAAQTGDLDITDGVNIVGATDGSGKPATIIQAGTTNSNGIDKVFSINPNFNAAFDTNFSNLVIRFGKNPSPYAGDGFGGAFDWEASGTGTLTVTNCLITDNSTTDGDGGGITVTNTPGGSGVFTITNSTVQNNVAQRGAGAAGNGGGIFVGGQTRIAMTNTKILNNQAIQSGGEGGGIFIFDPGTTPVSTIHGGSITGNQSNVRGGGIRTGAGLTIDQGTIISNNQSGTGAGVWSNLGGGETATLSNLTITGNTASGAGGGIAVDNSASGNNLQMSFSRIAGNSAPAGSNLSNVSGSVIAKNNWWGTTAPIGTFNGPVTFDPFITLSNTASPGTLQIGGTSTITASFAQDNHGTPIAPSNLGVLIGLPAAGSIFPDIPVHGTVSNVQNVIQANGTATETYTATSGGVETIHASIDSAAVPATVTVLFPPSISASFGAATIAPNATTSLSFTITNQNAGNAINGVGFADPLPAGLAVGTPNGLTGSCGGGTITATAGTANITLAGATIAAASSCTFSVTVKGLVDGVQNNTTGTVTSTNAGPGNTASATLTVIAAPVIAKTFGAASILLNGSTSLSFTVSNANTFTTLNGLAFTDSMPAGLVVASPSGLTGSCGGGTITAAPGASSVVLSGASLAAAASCTFSVNVTGTTSGVKNNSVTVSSTNGGTGNTSNASISVVAAPTISKSFGAVNVPLNGTTALTFSISNPNGVTSLSGIAFTDVFPAGLAVATPNGLTGTCGGTITSTAGTNVVQLSGATLAASASCSFSVNVIGIAAGAQNNVTGAITSTEGGTGGTASASVAIVAPPSIAKVFGASTIALNGTTSLSFTITNPAANTVALSGVGFTDTFPAGLVVATPSGLTGNCGGIVTSAAGSASVVLAGGTIAKNGSCTFSVNVTGISSGNLINTTGNVFSTEGGNGNTASATVSVAAPPSITKTFGAATIPLNGSTSLSFTITNPVANSIALNGVAFTDSLPAGLVVSTPSGLAGSCGGGTITSTAGSSSVILAGATLPASGSCTFSVNVTGTTVGVKNNSVTVTSTNAGAGNTSNASLSVVAPPTIAKSFGASSIALNGSTALTLSLTNPNTTTSLTAVAFTDTLPAGMVVATPNGLTSSCGGTVTSTSGSGAISLSGATLAASASCSIVVNVTGTTAGVKNNVTGAVGSSEGGSGGTASASLTVNQGTPVITWTQPTAITYGTALSGTQLNATATVPGTFVYTPAAGAILGVGTQTLNVTFTPTDTADYTTATASVSLVVNQATPVITWAQPAAIGYGTALSATQLNATASVPGTFVYAPAAGTVLAVGTHALNVTFTPTDAANYTTATASVTLVVNNATPVITWAQPAAITYGTALSATQLNATASVPGTFIYNPAAGTVLGAGSQTLNVTFNPSDSVNYSSANASVTLTVNKALPTVTWAQPAAITYGTPLSATQLNATASVPGTFAYVPSAGTVLTVGTQTLNVTFTPTDAANYTTATANVSIVVGKGAPVITWAQPAAITYGTALGAAQLNATASVPGSFLYSPAAGTVLGAGPQTLNVTFTPTDPANYTTATSSVSLTVNRAMLTVTADDKARAYGTANPALTYSITGFVNADGPGVISGAPVLTTTAALASPIGSYPINITPGTLGAANYNFQFVAGTLNVGGIPLTVKANDATKVYGAPVPTFMGTVTGAVNGDIFTETFSTNAVMLSAPGAYTIIPAVMGVNLANYSVIAVDGTLTVTKAPTMTTLTSSGSPTLSGASVTFTAMVASSTTGTPTGAVVFSDGSTTLATVPIVAGTAAFSTTTLAAGQHTITASYSGDINFLGSTSAGVTQTVNTTFMLSTFPTALTIGRGEAGQIAVFIAPGTGFTGTVQFSCTNLPMSAGCLFTPTQVSFTNGNGSQTVRLVVYAHAVPGFAKLNTNDRGAMPTIPALAFWLPGLALSGIGLRRKRSARQRQLLLLAVLGLGLGGMMGITGCGSGHFPSTAAGTYTVQVVGTSGGQQQSVPLTVTIK